MPITIDTLTTHNEETKSLGAWSAQFGLPYKTLYARFKRGVRGAELFAKPRAYKHKRQSGLPSSMTQTEALLLSLDDYDRDLVKYYCAKLEVTPDHFVNQALHHIFKRLEKAGY